MKTGINFEAYDEVEVEKRGGLGEEEPCESFQECAEKFTLPEVLKTNLERCKYSNPTPVQKHAMPAGLMGTDVMVCAQTGSGKTAAFLVPLITKCVKEEESPLEEGPLRPQAVILAPTRELVQQISEEARKLALRAHLDIVAIYGGADAVPQLQILAEGCDLAICTPGRLEDFLQRGVMSMKDCKYLVLDEADRMLDMGFEPQIRSILTQHGMPLPGEGEGTRQTMMFSATFPKAIQGLAQDFLDPRYLWLAVGRVGSAAASVSQKFKDASPLDDDGKFEMLLETIKDFREKSGTEESKILVFANVKHTVDEIAWALSDKRIRAMQIHGGLTQPARDRALNDFRNGRVNVLVATDVAARGLDLPGIDHVINYELPKQAEDYVHRIGRTGRIGNSGLATSFVGGYEPALRGIVYNIKEKMKEEGDDGSTRIPRWVVEQAVKQGGGGRPGRRGGDGYGRGRKVPQERFDNAEPPPWAQDLPQETPSRGGGGYRRRRRY